METKTKWIVEAAILAVGMVLLGLSVRSGIRLVAENTRVVTVKGLAEREVKADKAILPVQFAEVGNDLPSLYGQVEKKNAVILDFLKQAGIDDSEITSRVDVSDMDADYYTADKTPYRYRLTSVITVNTNKVDAVLGLLNNQKELIRQGIPATINNYSVQFEFTGLNEIKPEMIKEATQNARKAAEQFAIDSESSLGKIKSANQGQFTITDRDMNTPYIKNVRVVTTIQYSLEN